MDRGSVKVDREHLEDFVRTRRGVEGYVEPRTAVTETTLLLVAVDGEWTRRRVPSPPWAHIDIAGPSYNTGAPWGYTPKGGTGVPVRTLLATIEDLIADS